MKKQHSILQTQLGGIYLLPNFFTLGSIFCAFYAIVESMNEDFSTASMMIFLSMVFDGMDGRVARLSKTQSSFGEQFDSVADMMAFGVAPALIAYQFALDQMGDFGWAAAFIFCAGAAIRLARFNTNIGYIDKGFFQGMASPAAAALVMGAIWLLHEHLTPVLFENIKTPLLAFLCIYAGLTMISTAPFLSGKNASLLRKKSVWVALVVILLCVALFPWHWAFSVYMFFCVYAVSGYVFEFYLWLRKKGNPVKPNGKTFS